MLDNESKSNAEDEQEQSQQTDVNQMHQMMQHYDALFQQFEEQANNQMRSMQFLAQRMDEVQENSKITSQLCSCINWVRALIRRACIYLKSHSISFILILLPLLVGIVVWIMYFQNYQPLTQSKVKVSVEDDPVLRDRLNKIELDYLRHLNRHVVIEMALWDYKAECHAELQSYKEQTGKLQKKAEEIKRKLYEKCGEAPKYSDEYLEQQKGKYAEFMEDIDKRKSYTQCMREQIKQLEGLDKDIIKGYAAHDTFKWHDMMYQEGLCEDRSRCLCEILMKPNKQLERLIERTKTRIY